MAVRVPITADVIGQAAVDRLNLSLQGIGTQAARVGRLATIASRGIAALFAAQAVIRFTQAATRASDTITSISNQLRAAGVASNDLVTAQSQVLALANQTRSSYEATGGLFARVLRSSRQLGISQEQALNITRSFQQSLALSGASTQEAAAASLQFGQALASGRLQGDELRSILENNSFFAQALAMNLGVGVGQLRELGSQGVLTSEVLAQIAQEIAPMINDRFGELTPTFAQAWTVFTNGLNQAIGRFGRLITQGTGLSSFVQRIGNQLSEIFGPDGAGFNFDNFTENVSRAIMNVNWVNAFATMVNTLGELMIGLFRGLFNVAGSIGIIILNFFIDVANDFGNAIANYIISAVESAINRIANSRVGSLLGLTGVEFGRFGDDNTFGPRSSQAGQANAPSPQAVEEALSVASNIGTESGAAAAQAIRNMVSTGTEDGLMDAITSAGDGIEDTFRNSLVNAVTGRGSFRDVLTNTLDAVANSFAQVAVMQLSTGLAASVFGGSGGGGFFSSLFAGFFQNGGNIPAGQVGIVGEAGPEFVSGPATVTPMGMGQTININISGNVDERAIQQIQEVVQSSPRQVGNAASVYQNNVRGINSRRR